MSKRLPDAQWIRPSEAAERLDIDSRCVYDLVDDGKLAAAVHPDGGLIIDSHDVDEVAEQHSDQP